MRRAKYGVCAARFATVSMVQGLGLLQFSLHSPVVCRRPLECGQGKQIDTFSKSALPSGGGDKRQPADEGGELLVLAPRRSEGSPHLVDAGHQFIDR